MSHYIEVDEAWQFSENILLNKEKEYIATQAYRSALFKLKEIMPSLEVRAYYSQEFETCVWNRELLVNFNIEFEKMAELNHNEYVFYYSKTINTEFGPFSFRTCGIDFQRQGGLDDDGPILLERELNDGRMIHTEEQAKIFKERFMSILTKYYPDKVIRFSTDSKSFIEANPLVSVFIRSIEQAMIFQ